MKPIRVQRKRTRGWRKPENTVNVCRPSKYGNPFTFGDYMLSLTLLNSLTPVKNDELTNDKGIDWMISSYETMLLNDTVLLADVKQNLKGKNLMCFCSLDKKCHADILLKLANE